MKPILLGLTILLAGLADDGHVQEASFTQGVDISDSDILSADLFVNSNSSLSGRVCMGSDCTDDESFGTNLTLKIKGTRPNIYFRDTSSLLGTPTRDWSIEINEEVGFGQDRFSIRDLGSNRRVFTLLGGAPSSSLVIDNSGEVGFGTALPQADLHIAEPSSPKIRLQQTGGGGIVPQTWDITANDFAFYVEDVSESGTPFIIRTGAPSFALDIRRNGNIGFGTSSPQSPLHVLRATGAPIDMMRLENNDGVTLRMVDGAVNGQEWTMQSNDGLFRIASPAVPGPELTLDDNGNMMIQGQLTTAGSCALGCDRVFDEGYDLPLMEEHHTAMWANGYLPNIGPTPENSPFNVTDKMGRMLNELEHAHIYISQLHDRLAREEAQNARQTELIAELSKRLERLEAR